MSSKQNINHVVVIPPLFHCKNRLYRIDQFTIERNNKQYIFYIYPKNNPCHLLLEEDTSGGKIVITLGIDINKSLKNISINPLIIGPMFQNQYDSFIQKLGLGKTLLYVMTTRVSDVYFINDPLLFSHKAGSSKSVHFKWINGHGNNSVDLLIFLANHEKITKQEGFSRLIDFKTIKISLRVKIKSLFDMYNQVYKLKIPLAIKKYNVRGENAFKKDYNLVLVPKHNINNNYLLQIKNTLLFYLLVTHRSFFHNKNIYSLLNSIYISGNLYEFLYEYINTKNKPAHLKLLSEINRYLSSSSPLIGYHTMLSLVAQISSHRKDIDRIIGTVDLLINIHRNNG